MKKLPIVGSVILAVLSAVIAYLYFTKTAADLPHFLPGYLQGSDHKHIKHGIVFAVVTIAFLVGGWMLSGQDEKSTTARKH
ncbi:MAG: hypothetical protein NVS1B10_03100 [Candidatus Saccharimonadales bacterium]